MFQQDTAQKLYDLLSLFHEKSKRVEKSIGLTRERLEIITQLVMQGPKTINQLAEQEAVSAPAITRTIKALEKQGFVIKSRSKTDQRVVFVAPTRKSQQVVDAVRLQQQKWISEILELADKDELELVASGVTTLIKLYEENKS
ncbi:MarR family winged helix-turn-helix transcriptional regulator [Kangiella spongicola]|uniref:MarR family transcriptional regulator n=1 Tax=Kangiella spongicola TaxID=796379 RepID=A0A318D721_9GAMM|nr:MarR family transcriptional regulator [Kangiella spongicola]PXF62984.1 MarR family transcriptional regulator [Kangiella spongicola]